MKGRIRLRRSPPKAGFGPDRIRGDPAEGGIRLRRSPPKAGFGPDRIRRDPAEGGIQLRRSPPKAGSVEDGPAPLLTLLPNANKIR